MELRPEVMTLLEELTVRVAPQQERLKFLREELKKPEVLAAVPVAEAYGREIQAIMDYLSMEANATGLRIDELAAFTGEVPTCKVTYH